MNLLNFRMGFLCLTVSLFRLGVMFLGFFSHCSDFFDVEFGHYYIYIN